jgi:hypothetical protein
MREWYKNYRENQGKGSKLKFIIIMVGLNFLVLFFYLPDVKERVNPPKIEIINKKITTDFARKSKDFDTFDYDSRPKEITYFVEADVFNHGGKGDVLMTTYLERSDSTYIVESEFYIEVGETLRTETKIGPLPYGDGKRLYFIKTEPLKLKKALESSSE